MKKKVNPTIIFGKEDITQKKLITRFLLDNEITFTPKSNVYQEYEAVIKVNNVSPLNRSKSPSIYTPRKTPNKKTRCPLESTIGNTESTALCSDTQRSRDTNRRPQKVMPPLLNLTPKSSRTPKSSQCSEVNMFYPFSYKVFSQQVSLHSKNKSVTPERKKTSSKAGFNYSPINRSLTPTDKPKDLFSNKDSSKFQVFQGQTKSTKMTEMSENSFVKPSPREEAAYIEYLCDEGMKSIKVKNSVEESVVRGLLKGEILKLIRSYDQRQNLPSQAPRYHQQEVINEEMSRQSSYYNLQEKTFDNPQNESINSPLYSLENYQTFSKQEKQKSPFLQRRENQINNKSPQIRKKSTENKSPTKTVSVERRSTSRSPARIQKVEKENFTFRNQSDVNKKRKQVFMTESDFTLESQSSFGPTMMSKNIQGNRSKSPKVAARGRTTKPITKRTPQRKGSEKRSTYVQTPSRSPDRSFEIQKENKTQREGISLPPCEMNIQFKSAKLKEYFARKLSGASASETHRNDISPPRSLNSHSDFAGRNESMLAPSEDLEAKVEMHNEENEFLAIENAVFQNKINITDYNAVLKTKDLNNENENERGKLACKSTCVNSQVSSLTMLQEKDSISVKSSDEEFMTFSSFEGRRYLASNESNPALTTLNTLNKKNGSMSNFGAFIKNQINELASDLFGEENIPEENHSPICNKAKEMNHFTLYEKVGRSNRTIDSLWRFESNESRDQEITFGENSNRTYGHLLMKKYT